MTSAPDGTVHTPYELAADPNGIWVTSLASGRVTRVTPPARGG